MIGKVLHNYKIISELGHGGMGIVYKAYDMKLDRFVAIKILKKEVTNKPHFIERFKREAKNHAKFSHQNIVTVYGFIEEEEMLGIVMEFVEGETLENLIERKIRLDIFETFDIILSILRGAAFAHSKGFVHRDIKPSNVVISSEGIPKMMDFGISKSIIEKGITQTGNNVGTLFYMSPEQIRGEEPTPASDIYSVGITLFEMLAGVPPFDYNTEYEVIEAHLKQQLPEIFKYSPSLPDAIQTILEKALNKKAQNRYNSCEEFAADIEKLKASISRYHKAFPVDHRLGTKKYKVKAALYAFLILALITGMVYFIFSQVNTLWKSGINPLIVIPKSGKQLQQDKIELPRLNWTVLKSGIQNNIQAGFFLNDSVGFLCGSSGSLLKTIDGGSSWSLRVLPYQNDLHTIYFDSFGNGLIGGDNSLLLKSTDAGETWTKVDFNFNQTIFKIKFINNNTGFITGSKGLIYKTKDGGKSWTPVYSQQNNLLYDIDFINEISGFAVGWNGSIIKTTDAGESWMKVAPFTQSYLKGIKFINSRDGFAFGGDGGLFQTNDGGINWFKIPVNVSYGIYGMQFIDENLGFAIGGQGKMLITNNGGISWQLSEINVYASLNAVVMTPSKKIFAVGVNGTIIKY